MRSALIQIIVIIGLVQVLWLSYRANVKDIKEPSKIEKKVPEIKVEISPEKIEVKVLKKPTSEVKPEPPKLPQYPRTYQEAKAIAKQQKKNMLIYFTDEVHCSTCRIMKKYTFPNPDVKTALKQFVFYRIDSGGPDSVQFKRWTVVAVPTYVVATHDEDMVRSGAGYRTPKNFITWLRGPQSKLHSST